MRHAADSRDTARKPAARHVLGNPAYAVLYAHAAATAVLRWAGSPPGEFRPGRLAAPGELLLLDALSWLPERVATAARRGRRAAGGRTGLATGLRQRAHRAAPDRI